jgi:Tfp pilus assembly protein PilF
VLAGAAVLLGAGCVIARPIFTRQAAAAEVALALRTGQPLAVRTAAERLARADDTDALSAMSAARVFAALGDHARALDLAGEATRRDPKCSSAWRLRAEAAEALGRPAGTFYDRAIELDPANARLRLAYAGWLLRRGQIDQGSLQIRAARQIDDALRSFDPQSNALLGPHDWRRLGGDFPLTTAPGGR